MRTCRYMLTYIICCHSVSYVAHILRPTCPHESSKGMYYKLSIILLLVVVVFVLVAVVVVVVVVVV